MADQSLAQVPTPEMPVIAGMDVIVYQHGKLLGWATDAGFDEDFHLEPINSLGFHGPRGHKSTNYSCSVRISTFVLNNEEEDQIQVFTRRNIQTAGLLNFQLVEKGTGLLLYELRGCKLATHSANIDQSLSRRQTRWECVEVVPVNAF